MWYFLLVLVLVPHSAASKLNLESPAARFIHNSSDGFIADGILFYAAQTSPRYYHLDIPSSQFRWCSYQRAALFICLLYFSFPYVQGTGFVAHTSRIQPLSTVTVHFILTGACSVTKYLLFPSLSNSQAFRRPPTPWRHGPRHASRSGLTLPQKLDFRISRKCSCRVKLALN